MALSLELFRWFGFIEMGLPYCVALALVSSGVSWLRAGRARTLALPDVVLNLSCALMYLIFRQLLARVAFYPYITVYYTYALIDDTVMYETMASWLAVHSATFLAVDFTYYCTCGTSRHPIASSNRVMLIWLARSIVRQGFHRLLHRMHLLWAAHALRHSSATVNAFSAFRYMALAHMLPARRPSSLLLRALLAQTLVHRGRGLVDVLRAMGARDPAASARASRASQRLLSGAQHHHPPADASESTMLTHLCLVACSLR